MLSVVAILSSVALLASAQTCSNSGIGPCVSATCPTGTTCITASNTCCANANLVTTTCVDKLNPSTGVSDCTKMAAYCNNSAYYTLMTDQCPRTCGRCTATTTSVTSTCVDLVNPSTGVSDCPRMVAYCQNSAYYTLMTQQCSRTCGRCSG